jgi:hypothetical protein
MKIAPKLLDVRANYDKINRPFIRIRLSKEFK